MLLQLNWAKTLHKIFQNEKRQHRDSTLFFFFPQRWLCKFVLLSSSHLFQEHLKFETLTILCTQTRKLSLPYQIQAGRADLRPYSRPTAGTCTAPGPSRRWCNTSGSWWGLGTAPCLATRFSHHPPFQTDAPQLGPPAPLPREEPWSYCSLQEEDTLISPLTGKLYSAHMAHYSRALKYYYNIVQCWQSTTKIPKTDRLSVLLNISFILGHGRKTLLNLPEKNWLKLNL